MKQLRTIFLRGLLTFIPIAITIYVLYILLNLFEGFLGGFIKRLVGPDQYIPGTGFLLTILLIFAFGLLLGNFLVGSFLRNLEDRLTRVPLIKAVYSPLKDLMNLFSKQNGEEAMKSVVFVDFGPHGMKAMGLVTRESFSDLSGVAKVASSHVSVYFPMSYGLGGFTFLVPKDKIQIIDLPIERAMSLAITGWVKSESKNEQQ